MKEAGYWYDLDGEEYEASDGKLYSITASIIVRGYYDEETGDFSAKEHDLQDIRVYLIDDEGNAPEMNDFPEDIYDYINQRADDAWVDNEVEPEFYD